MLFKNKYRIESTRLPDNDYSQPGFYFVTICTKHRECLFGKIIDNNIVLNSIGNIIDDEWLNTFILRTGVIMDEYCIMPNHFLGIIEIVNVPNANVETHCNASLQLCNKPATPNNLSNIIRGFKSSATNKIHTAGFMNFHWQSRFYEHVIRDSESLDYIRQYIRNNPANWNKDKMNPGNKIIEK